MGIKKTLVKFLLNRLDLWPNYTSMSPIADSLWYEYPNYWEPNVVITLRDLLSPGDIFWDIGANVGGITRIGSRLVGPNGVVIGVEASLDNYRKLNHNIVLNNLNNFFGIHAAIWHTSNEEVYIFKGDGGNDSLLENPSLTNGGEWIKSVTLDEIADNYGRPDLIKLDIEGVEYEALLGGLNLIRINNIHQRPLIILEQSSENMRALNLLLENDYIAQDLSTGDVHISTPNSHPDNISNWLAIPRELESKWAHLIFPFSEKPTAVLDMSSASEGITLEPGRYRAIVDIKPSHGENIYICFWNNSKLISRYHGNAAWLQQSYRSRQFDFLAAGIFKVTIESPNKDFIPVSTITSVALLRKQNFEPNYASYRVCP